MIVTLSFCLKGDKTDFKKMCRDSWFFPVSVGVLNAFSNLLIILMASTTLPPSLIYPVLSIGGLSLTTLTSAFAFKEKLQWWQWVGIGLGAVAIGLLA